MKQNNPNKQILPISILIIVMTLPIFTACSDFIDHPDKSQSPSQTQTEPETPQSPVSKPEPEQNPVTKPEPYQPTDPTNPIKPTNPIGKPTTAPKTETFEQRNWRACEAERMWAFTTHLIDVNALRLFQQRNLAPVFNDPGVRQSGIEGWYSCAKALEMNGFVDGD